MRRRRRRPEPSDEPIGTPPPTEPSDDRTDGVDGGDAAAAAAAKAERKRLKQAAREAAERAGEDAQRRAPGIDDDRLRRIERQVDALLRATLTPSGIAAPDARVGLRRFGLHSAFEEDGITLAIHDAAGVDTRRFVELGCGPSGGNAGVLAAELGWSGLMVDADEEAVAEVRHLNPMTVTTAARWVTAESVDEVIGEHAAGGAVDQLGIGLRGNDYWIWKAVEAADPRLVVVAFNSSLGPHLRLTIPYDPGFRRPSTGALDRLYFGASLGALVALGRERGYRLVAVEPHGADAFFLREDLAPELPAREPSELFRFHVRHRPFVGHADDVVAELRTIGLKFETVRAPAQPVLPARLHRVTPRDEVFSALAHHAPFVGVSTDSGSFVVDTGDQVVGRLLFTKRGRAETRVLAAAVAALARHGAGATGVFLDCGANIGTTTVPAVLRHGFGRALAFEPEPANFRLLAANVALNGLMDQVTLRPAAVSATEGELTMLLDPGNSGGHEVLATGADSPEPSPEGSVERLTVPAVTLDAELERLGLDAREVGLWWIDVQGHEAAVLAGGSTLLAAGVPVVCEFDPEMLRRAGELPALMALVASAYSVAIDLRAPGDLAPRDLGLLDELAAGTGRLAAGEHTDLLLLP